jgi:hypothetical protein
MPVNYHTCNRAVKFGVEQFGVSKIPRATVSNRAGSNGGVYTQMATLKKEDFDCGNVTLPETFFATSKQYALEFYIESSAEYQARLANETATDNSGYWNRQVDLKNTSLSYSGRWSGYPLDEVPDVQKLVIRLENKTALSNWFANGGETRGAPRLYYDAREQEMAEAVAGTYHGSVIDRNKLLVTFTAEKTGYASVYLTPKWALNGTASNGGVPSLDVLNWASFTGLCRENKKYILGGVEYNILLEDCDIKPSADYSAFVYVEGVPPYTEPVAAVAGDVNASVAEVNASLGSYDWHATPGLLSSELRVKPYYSNQWTLSGVPKI